LSGNARWGEGRLLGRGRRKRRNIGRRSRNKWSARGSEKRRVLSGNLEEDIRKKEGESLKIGKNGKEGL